MEYNTTFLIRFFILLWISCLTTTIQTFGQIPVNYDENQISPYTLPELLVNDNGTKVTTSREWENIRRKEIIKKFEDHVYGRIPGKPANMSFTVKEKNAKALNGKATRIQTQIWFSKDKTVPPLTVLLYLPNAVKGKAPIFVGLNFNGNHTIHADPDILITDQYKKIKSQDSTLLRGAYAERWALEELINAGYGVATAFYQDLEEDHKDGYKTGVRTLLQKDLKIRTEEWAALTVWGWGLSRIVDYLETIPQADAKRFFLVGHSRIGKAALWAAANDKRFAMIISNNSGEGGAALARRNYGETVEHLNTRFPHWFIERFKSYSQSVDKLPVDQHMLLALMAPRPLYVASATEDQWADPKGEFMAAFLSEQVYNLYGKKGLGVKDQPAPENPVGETIGYHLRTGKHDITKYDWEQYIQFARRNFK
jgi:hypothetical protein